jgi:hypothetical protein
MVLGEMLMGIDLEGEEPGEASKCMLKMDEVRVRVRVRVRLVVDSGDGSVRGGSDVCRYYTPAIGLSRPWRRGRCRKGAGAVGLGLARRAG